MNIRYILAIICLLPLFSCEKDFLQRDPGVNLTKEDVFKDPNLAGRFADRTYNFRIDDYGKLQSRGQNFRFSIGELTDESVSGSLEPGVSHMYSGNWTDEREAMEMSALFNTSRGMTPYQKLYTGIRNANVMLEEIDNVPWDAPSEPKRSGKLIKAEQLFLRAMLYHELAKRWGGVILMDKPLSLDDNTDLPRSTFEETIAFIERDLDAAEELLNDPEFRTTLNAANGFKENDGSPIYTAERGWNPLGGASGNNGRADLGSLRSLRSTVLLLAASPLHNPSNDAAKWQKAAAAAKSVIDMNLYALHPAYQDILEVPVSSEHIMIQIRGPRNGQGANFFGSYVIAPSFGGARNGLNPTQNHVDLYEMANGKRITDSGTGSYDPQNPYANRDPRLNHNVLVNDRSWKGRKLEMWYTQAANGTNTYGRDAGINTRLRTVTGYYSRKMWPEALVGNSASTAFVHFIYWRYAEILLDYAEAINEASSSGFTQAIPYLDQIRGRVKMPGVATTMANRGLSPNQNTMRELIHNERAIELAFENKRWWDILRWRKGPVLVAQPMRGMDIKKEGADFVYTPFVLPTAYQKTFTDFMHFYPIPRSELITSNRVLVNNPGWPQP